MTRYFLLPSVRRAATALPAWGDNAEQWLAGATETPGSWWDHWIKWLAPQAGKAVAARRTLGNKKYRVIEPAPGRYVKVRASQP